VFRKTPLLLSLFRKRKEEEEEKRNPRGILSYLDFVRICANIGDKCSDDAV